MVAPVVNPRPRLLLVSGSLRGGSTNTAVLRTALALGPAGVDAELFDGLAGLPHFNPDNEVEPLDVAVSRLRRMIRASDAIVFCTPEYAGALPGSFKNLLDWTIGDDRPGSIYNKPVAWLNASPRGAVLAHDSLRAVLGYAHADVVEPACVHVPVTSAMIGDDGLIADPPSRERITSALAALLEHLVTRV